MPRATQLAAVAMNQCYEWLFTVLYTKILFIELSLWNEFSWMAQKNVAEEKKKKKIEHNKLLLARSTFGLLIQNESYNRTKNWLNNNERKKKKLKSNKKISVHQMAKHKNALKRFWSRVLENICSNRRCFYVQYRRQNISLGFLFWKFRLTKETSAKLRRLNGKSSNRVFDMLNDKIAIALVLDLMENTRFQFKITTLMNNLFHPHV